MVDLYTCLVQVPKIVKVLGLGIRYIPKPKIQFFSRCPCLPSAKNLQKCTKSTGPASLARASLSLCRGSVQESVARLAHFVGSRVRPAEHGLGTAFGTEHFAAVLAPVLPLGHAEDQIARGALLEVFLVLHPHL